MNSMHKNSFDLPKIILVLGMHRSGTSLVAQLIAKWGAFMGNDLMPADKFNSDGYWEYNPLFHFHEKLLEKTNNKWYAPSEEINTKELLIEFGDEARLLVKNMDQSGDIWCWKDPRMSLFMDFWNEILAGREIIHIVVNRPPNDIASSLLVRDKMPAILSISLWEYTTIKIFQKLSNESNYRLIDYEKIILYPEISCKDLFNYLNKSSQLKKSQIIYNKMVQSIKKPLNHAKPGKITLNQSQRNLQQIIEKSEVPTDYRVSEYELLFLKEIFSLYGKLGINNQIFHFAQLFYKNKNNAFNENYSLIKEVRGFLQTMHFKFDNPLLVNNLRFDPLNDYLQVQINSIKFLHSGKLLDAPFMLSSNTLFYENNIYLFNTKDPQIYIDFENDISLEIDEVIIDLNYIKTGSEAFETIISYKEDLIKKQQEEINIRSLENETILLENKSLIQKTISEEVKNQDLKLSYDLLKQSYDKNIFDNEQQQKELIKQLQEKKALAEHNELLILRLKNVEEKNLELQNSINEHTSKQITLEEQNQDYNESINRLKITLIEYHQTIDDLDLQLKQTKLELDKLQSIPGIRFFHKTMFLLQHFIPDGSMKEILSRLKYFRIYFSIKHSNLFDQAYYLNNNPDIKSTKTSAIRHYILYGGFEGRNPSKKFDSSFYIKQYPDVKTSGINPLIHYIRFGRKEGRLINYNTTGYKSMPVNENISAFSTPDVPVLSTDDTRENIPHFAPPVDDYSLLVPFNYQSKIIEPAPSIAVVCHIFYLDLLDEIIGYMSNIPYKFDLFISTDTPEKVEVISMRFNEWEDGKVEIRLAINRGRDIAPKLIMWPEVYRNYEYFLHIHTKKTIQENILFGWRTYLLETLLGSPEIIKSIFEAFISDPNLGIIAPQHYSTIRHAIGWGYNYTEASQFADSLGINISIENPIDFPSGSMFWARSKAILPLINSGITIQDFPEEKGQIDNTLAHVIERLYYHVCEKAGYSWIKIVNPLQSPNAERCLKVNEQSELLNLINRIKTPLLLKTENNQLISEASNHLIKNIISGLKNRRNYFLFKNLFINSALKKVDKRAYYRKIFIKSPYSDLDFEGFINQMELHIAGKESSIDFDEEFYLKANKDIAKLVSLGLLDSGFTHFCLSGKNENRIWSNKLIKTKFQLTPNFPEGFFSPTNIKPKQNYPPILKKLEKSKEPFLLILFAHLQSDLFYAGYTAFFRDFLPVFEQFSKITISVESNVYEPKLAKQYYSKIEVVNQNQLYNLKTRPDVILCFSNQLFTKASKLFSELDKTVYYCQEYEAGFFPYGSEFIEAEKAIANSKNIIISTVLLKNFIEKKNLLNDKRIYVTSPKIEQIDIKSGKWNKLFFYFRPEYFHARNIPEILWETVHEFCQKHKGYEIYMVGSIETRFSFEINGNPVFVLNKLPTEQYNELIATCDVVIAMIYSAHPGVIAFQTAASGIPTVTNIFESRDQNILKQISENFVPYNPVKDSLLEKIELALSLPKGIKSFDQELYGGKKEDLTLSEFILKIWNQ
jgi:hypothetical protein